MVFRILELDTGNISLEFSEADFSRLREMIQNVHGEIRSKLHIMHDGISFGGCGFLFYNEWDDPCLISQCTKGAEILRSLARALSN